MGGSGYNLCKWWFLYHLRLPTIDIFHHSAPVEFSDTFSATSPWTARNMSFLKVLQKKSKSSDMHCAPLTNLSEEYGTTIYLSMLYSCCIWVFPKIGGKNPNHPILIGFSIIFTIHFGGLKSPYFWWKHPQYQSVPFAGGGSPNYQCFDLAFWIPTGSFSIWKKWPSPFWEAGCLQTYWHSDWTSAASSLTYLGNLSPNFSGT